MKFVPGNIVHRDCPFCGVGGALHFETVNLEGDTAQVCAVCAHCGARGPLVSVDATDSLEYQKILAVEAWGRGNGQKED